MLRPEIPSLTAEQAESLPPAHQVPAFVPTPGRSRLLMEEHIERGEN